MDPADAVLNRARTFLTSVLPILNEEFQHGNDQPLEFGWPTWIPEAELVPGMRRFKAQTAVFSAERQCAVRVLGELREAGMEQLSKLEEALAADPVIGPRTRGDSVTSFGAGGGAWQAYPVVLMLVEHVIEGADGFDVAPAGIDELTTEWAAMLRRSADRVTVVTALREFEAPVVPIEVEPGLEIVELRDDEIAAALRFGGGMGSLRLDERTISTTFGIRATFDSRLFIDAIPEAEAAREQTAREKTERDVGLVLPALRAFQTGRVSASGTFQYVTSWAGVSPVQGSVGPWFGWHSGQPYVLAADDVRRFRDFWPDFKAARHHRVVESALRRFDYAADRGLADDEIVDLMIAAESLFLRDAGRPQERGEMTFRLATRVPSFLGESREERLRLLSFMRHAYGVRSAIVHGGAVKEADLRGLDGGPTNLGEFADALEEVLRRSLHKAIGRVSHKESFPPAWDELLFAE